MLLVLSCKEGESGLVYHPEFLKQGLLYVQDVAKKGKNACQPHKIRLVKIFPFLFALIVLNRSCDGVDRQSHIVELEHPGCQTLVQRAVNWRVELTHTMYNYS